MKYVQKWMIVLVVETFLLIYLFIDIIACLLTYLFE
jgi:hypothetical protein